MFGVPGYNKHQGGKVRGPGTGTSDSIKASVPAGSYIMPADSAEAIGDKKLAGFGAPGWKGNPATAQQSQPGGTGVPVNLSNGEHQLPPEQVHAVGVQALDSIKQATHTPTGRGVPRKELFFADGGLVEDPARKRTSFDMTNTASAGRGVPGLRGPLGNPAQSPALSPQGVQSMALDAASRPAQSEPGQASRPGRGVPGYVTFGDGLAGGAKALIGASLVPQAALADAVRNTATLAAGGDPNSLEGGQGKYRDQAVGMAKEGWNQADHASQGFRDSAREALGAKPFPTAGAPTAAPASAATPPVPSEPTATGAGRGAPGWSRTGIGVDQQGGEIAMRTGAGGVPEFTNEAATPGSVSGGVPGYGGNPRPADRPQPRLGVPGYGSAENVGNGVGTFSQAEAGSSQLALERFERANQERGRMVEEAQAGELGNNGGRVTVVRDSSRMPTRQERVLALQEGRLAETEALRARTANESGESAVRTAAEQQRMGTEGLNQQRLKQQIEEGDVAAVDRNRLEQLRAAIADPATSEQDRNAARQAYNVLATQAKDRYITQDVILGVDDNNRPIVGKQVLDVTTGQPVAGAQTVVPPTKAIEALRGDPNLAAEFDVKFGAGASQRYLGGGAS